MPFFFHLCTKYPAVVGSSTHSSTNAILFTTVLMETLGVFTLWMESNMFTGNAHSCPLGQALSFACIFH